MSAPQQLLLAGTGGIVNPFSTWNVFADSSPGVSAVAQFNVGNDGAITYSATNNDGTATGSLNWYSSTTSGIGSLFYCRLTATSGTFTTNGASSFTSLSSGISSTKSSTAGNASVTFTLEIATDSGGTNIVLTSTGNVLRYTHT
ncbi:MAG: hypothetical protein QM813_16985 [Verrucomicrobiota bacterium]